jgi:hypothetical protein
MLVLALLLVAATAAAQPSPIADPVFHGVLGVRPSRGAFDPESGIASLTLRSWRFLLYPDSNAIFPDQEPIVIDIGENSLPLAAGMLVPSRNGKTFTYRAAPEDTTQPIRLLRIKQTKRSDTYRISLTLRDLDFRDLINNDGDCLPIAVIIGDDDGFNGGIFTRPSFGSRRLRIPRSCVSPWPWQR